jgi:hypothetical protein
MKFFYIVFFLLFFSKLSFANDIFETIPYEISFYSKDINKLKENKIDEVKIKSFNYILKNILTSENIKKIKTDKINFTNKFILNYKIEDEKIINNHYFAKVKVNFNSNLLINYFVENQISYNNSIPDNFLLLVYEKDELQNNFLSEENNFYKFLKNSKNKLFKKYFVVPNLDFNDRYLFSDYQFENNIIKQNILLNDKYNTTNQILVNSIKIKSLIINDVYLFHDNKKYFVKKIPINKMNYEKLLKIILHESINKWKEINQIDTSSINVIDCKIDINNVNELTYVRNLLISNKIIQTLSLKTIELNRNFYEIKFFGSKKNLQKTLRRNRLQLLFQSKSCDIKLI